MNGQFHIYNKINAGESKDRQEEREPGISQSYIIGRFPFCLSTYKYAQWYIHRESILLSPEVFQRVNS